MKYLGLDLGTKTIGLATSQGIVSSPYKTLRFEENNYLQAIKQLKVEYEKIQPKIVVVGWPKNMDGSEGHRVDMVKNYLKLFKQHLNLDEKNIVKVDERLTSRIAKSIMIEANLSRKKQKVNKDSLSAQLILETYLIQNNT